MSMSVVLQPVTAPSAVEERHADHLRGHRRAAAHRERQLALDADALREAALEVLAQRAAVGTSATMLGQGLPDQVAALDAEIGRGGEVRLDDAGLRVEGHVDDRREVVQIGKAARATPRAAAGPRAAPGSASRARVGGPRGPAAAARARRPAQPPRSNCAARRLALQRPGLFLVFLRLAVSGSPSDLPPAFPFASPSCARLDFAPSSAAVKTISAPLIEWSSVR